MAPHPYYCQNLPIQALKLGLVFEMVVTDGMATIIVFFLLLLFNEHQLSMNKEKRDGGKENERRKEKIK